MDHWDPALVNALAARRPVVLLDNAGVGSSGGEVPTSYAGWAQNVVDLLAALRHDRVDLFGFSMGGCAAQMVALNAPGLVRRLVLAGTSPSTGPGVKQYRTREELAAFARLSGAATDEEQREGFLRCFFSATTRSQEAGARAWARIAAGRPGTTRTPHVPPAGSKRQGIAFAKFMDPKQAKDASYERLGEIQIPVLIAGGKFIELSGCLLGAGL